MKILIMILITVGLYANIYPIGKKISITENLLIERAYQDYCDNGYVWRLYEFGRIGSYSQVFVKKQVDKHYISLPKTCKDK